MTINTQTVTISNKDIDIDAYLAIPDQGGIYPAIIVIQEISAYASYLAPSGVLLLSGFYTNDIADLNAEAIRYGLKEEKRDEKEGWASLLLRK